MPSTALAPRVNRRATGSEGTITNEAHTIGEDEANTVYLVELPLQESPSTVSVGGTPDGGGSFSEVSGTPSAGEFRVNYSGLGGSRIDFHADDADIDVTVSYKGRGSVLTANDINNIHDSIFGMSLNIKRHGADPTASAAVNTAAIAAAIEELSDGDGGRLYTGPGVFEMNGALLQALTGDIGAWKIEILGAGREATQWYNVHATQHLLRIDGIHTLTIKDICLRGDPTNTTGNIINLSSTDFQNYQVNLDNVWICSGGGNGIVGNPWNFSCRNSIFGGNSTDDVMVGGTAHLGKNHAVLSSALIVKFDNCWFADIQTGRAGILVQSGNNVSVRDCNFSSETTSASWFGVQSAGIAYTLVEACNFENDAVCTMNAGIQFLTNPWGGGRLAGNTFVANSGTITDRIRFDAAGIDDDCVMIVESHSGNGVVDMQNIATGWVKGVPYITPTNNANGRYYGEKDGGLIFKDGYRHTVDGWHRTNVTASLTAQVLDRSGVAGVAQQWIPVRQGSITGIVVRSTEARSAGTLTVEVYKNGVGTGLTAVLNGSNTTFKTTLQAKDADGFVAGDQIDVRITTDGSWAPTTADILVSIEVET